MKLEQRFTAIKRAFKDTMKHATYQMNRLESKNLFVDIKNDIHRDIRQLSSRLSQVSPSSLVSPLATYSVLAFMMVAISAGSAGSAGATNPKAVAAAVVSPTVTIEKSVESVSRTEADDYYSKVWEAPITPTATPTATATPQPNTVDTGNNATVSEDARQEASARSAERPAVPTPTNASKFQTEFIMSAVEPAQASQRETGVPASVTIAQAALESDWGRSGLSTKGHNYFGIKASKGPGPAGVINMNTGEHLNGQNVTVNAGFKAYHNMEESFEDHGHFLKDNERYSACFKTDDPNEFARRLKAAGYATDPQYATKLIRFMDTFNLYAYDVE